MTSSTLPISVIIITFNEENNIDECIESVKEIADEIFVVDSYSTDNTLKILRDHNCKIVHHKFENYSAQRNWALKNLLINNDWILNLDADHRVTKELAMELKKKFSSPIDSDIKGFLISRKTIFMDRWIKHGGHYPTYHANMFRKNCGMCEERLYDQHYLVEGKMVKLKGDIIDIISDSLSNFTERHNKWATMEAIEQLTLRNDKNKKIIKSDFKGNSIERRRSLRNFYSKFPLFVRPLLYFSQRYILRLGFLDGIPGLIFHFLQGFWYRFLIDAKIFEIKLLSRKENKSVSKVINEHYGIDINV